MNLEFMFFQLFRKRRKVTKLFVFNIKWWFGHVKNHEKSIKNQCKIDARKRYAKMSQNGAKIYPKSFQNPEKTEKWHPKYDAEI